MNKVIITLIILALLGGAVFWLVIRAFPSLNQNTPEIAAGRVTLTGHTVCLSHQDTSGPQTLECAFGLKAADSKEYALDVSGINQETVALIQTSEKEITLTGTLTPVVALSSDHWQKYNIVGVVQVDSITQTVSSSDSVSKDGLTMAYTEPFALAVSPQQIMQGGVIPPCSEPFAYCFYYSAATYAETNFEDAGVAVRERSDLNSDTCLSTPPAGYQNLTPSIQENENYSTAVFSGIGDAGAGHYATGDVYRLLTATTCFEFETRIAETQFGNYPAGSITEFTDPDRRAVAEKIRALINGFRLAGVGGALEWGK